MKKDYYSEINKELLCHEENRYSRRSIEWISDRIDWCWKFRKIKDKQLTELTERVIKLLERG